VAASIVAFVFSFGDTNDTGATFAGDRGGLNQTAWKSPRCLAARIGERPMLKMIVAVGLVVVITSSSAIASIVLTHAAFTRNSVINAGVMLDEAQSFRLAAKAPLVFDW